MRRRGLGGMLRNAIVVIILTGIFLLGWYIFDPAGFLEGMGAFIETFRN